MRKYILVFLSIFWFVTSASARPTAKITIKAINELGEAIQGAIVHVSFSVPNATGIGLSSIRKKGITNDKGLLVVSGETMGRIGFSIDKEGFYQSGAGYAFTTNSKLLNRWEPWNPTVEVVLKKKRNPVPMYDNHRKSYNIPEFDRPIGFDLENEDWVAPYGKGFVSDFVITFNSEIRAYSDYDCDFTLIFSNPLDGIKEYYFDENDPSNFKWPFEAPIDGYVGKIVKKKTISLPGKGYESNEKRNVNYLFRVRTQVDKEGNVIEAKYGKLEGEFGFVPKGKITFRYYFNPDGTRNLEEDPEKNFFDMK